MVAPWVCFSHTLDPFPAPRLSKCICTPVPCKARAHLISTLGVDGFGVALWDPEWLIVVTHEMSQALCQGIPIQSRSLTLTTPRSRFSDYTHLMDKNTEARRGGGACRRSLTSKGQHWALKLGLSDSEPYALDSVVEDLSGWRARSPL